MSIEISLRNMWRGKLTALIDGDYPWGALVCAPARYGANQQHLIVYPPGITTTDRRWLRVWRGFPLWGGLLWFFLQVCLVQEMAPWHATAVAVGVSAVVGVAAFVMAGQARHQVRTLHACVLAGPKDPELLRGQRRLRLLATTMLTAHAQYSRGEMSSVRYEQIWWQVYNAMAEQSDPPSRTRFTSQLG